MSSITHDRDSLSWKQADVDVHVATRDGEFAGFVEFDRTGHVVHDARGAELGSFETLADARRALEAVPRHRRRSIRQTLRRHLTRARA